MPSQRHRYMGKLMLVLKFIFAPVIAGIALLNPSIISVSSPARTASLVPTATVVSSPIADERLAYVQRQLVANGFEESAVNQLLTDQRRTVYPEQSVAYRAPNWAPIKRKLYSAAYVQEGKAFIASHRDAFGHAEQQFGVPKEAITGIIAIETEFGRNMGKTPTFNALYSRLEHNTGSSWPLQANRLVALSTYCLQARLDCFSITGSYAGAIGLVQFMPDSLMKYGIDGNGDHIVDLTNPDDAIPSAGNFLMAHGWAQDRLKALTGYYGSPVGYPAIVLAYAKLLAK